MKFSKPFLLQLWLDFPADEGQGVLHFVGNGLRTAGLGVHEDPVGFRQRHNGLIVVSSAARMILYLRSERTFWKFATHVSIVRVSPANAGARYSM